jgi:lanosterol synthase
LLPQLLRAEHSFCCFVTSARDLTTAVNNWQVNKTINMLCSWHAQGKDSKEFQRHVDRVADYLWLAEDGMKMQAYFSHSRG